MTDKEVRKLNRKELLEMLITQKKEIKDLREQIDMYEEKEQERIIKCQKAGSLADASLALNGVFESAQAAAKQYLLNIQYSESLCREKQSAAQAQANQIVAEAKKRAAEIEKQAKEANQQ